MVQGDIHRLERGLLDLFPILKLFYAEWLVKYPLCMKLASGSINRFLEAKFTSVQTLSPHNDEGSCVQSKPPQLPSF